MEDVKYWHDVAIAIAIFLCYHQCFLILETRVVIAWSLFWVLEKSISEVSKLVAIFEILNCVEGPNLG
jgi:hypothetical protein